MKNIIIYSPTYNLKGKTTVLNRTKRVLFVVALSLALVAPNEAYAQNIPSSSYSTIKNETEEFINVIKEVENPYEFASDYYLDNALDILEKMQTIRYSNIDPRMINNNQVSYDFLLTTIKRNNAKYIEERKTHAYDETNDEFLNKIVRIITDSINRELSRPNNNIDINSLYYKLLALKVYNFSGWDTAQYDAPRNVFSINYNVIPDMIRTQDNPDLLEDVTIHETMHLIQASSQDEVKKNSYQYRYGISSLNSSLPHNSLFWSWYFESSAEFLAIEKNGGYDTELYPLQMNAFNYINLATFINDSGRKMSLADLSLVSDPNVFFSFFDCKTKEDKKEIISMFYSMELLYGFQNEGGLKEFGKEKESIMRSLKSSICTTNTKIFYKNLINKYENSKMPLKDIYYLISIFEIETNRFSWVNKKSDEYCNFIKDYNDIQRTFFDYLASKTNNDTNTLLNDFNNYYSSLNSTSINTSLSTGEKEYLDFIASTRMQYKEKAINQLQKQSNKLT